MNGWFLTWFGGIFLIAMLPACDGIRARFFAASGFCWAFGGNLLAYLFMSAGPVYFGRVTGDVQRFDPIRTHISPDNPIGASIARLQETLWWAYSNDGVTIGAGISAFPSMHLASVTLMAVFISEVWRPIGIVLFAYVVAIQFSSVYLGWHYAIDGYFSISMVLLVYWSQIRFGQWIDERNAGTTKMLPAE